MSPRRTDDASGMFAVGPGGGVAEPADLGRQKVRSAVAADGVRGQGGPIYIDPPFNTGANFSYMATVPDDPEQGRRHGGREDVRQGAER